MTCHASVESSLELEETALLHLLFFPSLVTNSRSVPHLLETLAQDRVAAAVVYGASLLEAVGYAKAGEEVQFFLQGSRVNDGGSAQAINIPEQPQSWLDELSARVRHHAGQLISSKAETANILAKVLHETQQQYNERAKTKNSAAVSPCDALFVSLTADYLQHISTDVAGTLPYESNASLFQLAPPEPSSSFCSSMSTSERLAVVQQQRQWCEARLYAALMCAASITAPSPLARLLVAYVHAHAHDGRLQSVVDDNVFTHLSALHNKVAASIDSRGAPEEEQQRQPQSEKSALPEANVQTGVQLSGVVAGVFEFALHVARIRSSITVAALNATAHSTSTTSAAATLTPLSAVKDMTSFSKLPQSAALLLVQLTEECGYYQQTTSAATSESTATTTATVVVHAMQEVLFTIVAGGGTRDIPNRPEPTSSKKPTSSAASVTPFVGKSNGAAAAATTAASMLVSTIRGLSLPEADAVTQELFPSLVHQLGMEWPWSPLLRFLSTLDKQQQHQQPCSAVPTSNVEKRETPAPFHRLQLPVRWSSHTLMDTVLLSVAQKTYPQRLLNILPGSYEQLLENLSLMPPMPQQQGGGDDGAEGGAAAGRVARDILFDMPFYYAEPATALVSYFQRAGVSGLRLDEVSRILDSTTSSYAMIVRLKAQAPPLTEDEVDEEKHSTETATHAYVLSRERVRHLVARYQGEVLLAAIVVYTQLRTPSQVQQLMRAVAPLFLRIHLDWRTHHDGSIASWFLQQSSDASTGTCRVRFSSEAAVLLDKVGYEFYPLEWLPVVASGVCAASTAANEVSGSHNNNNLLSPPLPYSLCAAVSHQFCLQLRGTPLGSSGDVTLRHPAGPRTSVVMPTIETTSFFPDQKKNNNAGGDVETTAAAWRRAERFLTGFMQVCYLDPKTSSAELEGTLAVSSTRRVLTASDGGASQGTYGGASLIASADIASQRLRSLLQQHAVMDAVWGSMGADGRTGDSRSGSSNGTNRLTRQQHRPQRGQKRSRYAEASETTSLTETKAQLRAMRQLLLDYGASSFDTTVEAADFALTVAQSFLPSTAGMSAGASAQREKQSDALLQRALEWSRTVVGSSARRAEINMLLQQQRHKEALSGDETPFHLSLLNAYNSATLDMAWLARNTLRHVPRRIWEKVEVQQTQAYALAQREAKWVSRLPGSSGNDEECVEKYRVDPLLLEQWTQLVRVWQQLGFVDAMGGDDSFEVLFSTSTKPKSAEEMSCVQWLWYSPYFSTEWSRS